MKWFFIILAVILVLALVWFFATASGRKAKQAERNRQEAANIREQAADRQQELAQREADAAQIQAAAAQSQADAERAAREAERRQQEAAQVQQETQRARQAHDEQLRQADRVDPDIATDAEGYRLDDPQDMRIEGSAPVDDQARPGRDASADYQTTLQPRISQDDAQTSAVSYSEYPTEMSQRERLLRQKQTADQEIDLRDGRSDKQSDGPDGQRLADRIMDRDDPNA